MEKLSCANLLSIAFIAISFSQYTTGMHYKTKNYSTSLIEHLTSLTMNKIDVDKKTFDIERLKQAINKKVSLLVDHNKSLDTISASLNATSVSINTIFASLSRHEKSLDKIKKDIAALKAMLKSLRKSQSLTNEKE